MLALLATARHSGAVRPDACHTWGAKCLYLVAQLLINSDKTVVLEDPAYPDVRDIVSRRTDKIETLPVDEEGMVLDEAVLSRADIVCITPSHQCPTTTTMSLRRRHDLLALAQKYDFLILEDDYEFEMNFIEKPSPALKSLDKTGHVIYVGSLSKSLFPGLRLGYLVGSHSLISEARKLRHLILRHPPGHTQRTAAYFLALGHYEAQLRRLRRHLATRRESCSQHLNNNRYLNKLPLILAAPVFGSKALNGLIPAYWQSVRPTRRSDRGGRCVFCVR